MDTPVDINGPTANEDQPLLGYTKSEETTPIISRVWRRDCFPCLPSRYVLAFACFMGFCNVYALRVNLSLAIVVMWNDSSSDQGIPPHKVNQAYILCMASLQKQIR